MRSKKNCQGQLSFCGSSHSSIVENLLKAHWEYGKIIEIIDASLISKRILRVHDERIKLYINKIFRMNYVQGSTMMPVVTNNISQSAVHKSAIKADNSQKAESAFANYMDKANSEANNSQEKVNIDSENTTAAAESTASDNSAAPTELNKAKSNDNIEADNTETENTEETKSKNDLLSEIALFFVNNNTGVIENIPQVEPTGSNADMNTDGIEENSSLVINDLMQKIHQLIKQAGETETDAEAQAVNAKLREFAAATKTELSAISSDIEIGNSSLEESTDLNKDIPQINQLKINKEVNATNSQLTNITAPDSGTAISDKLSISSEAENKKQNIAETPIAELPNTANNNIQTQIANQTNTKLEINKDQTGTTANTASDAAGTGTSHTNTGATRNSGGNQTGQESKQDNTQRNIAFELSANQKEGGAIVGSKAESTFAEYDKSGTLRINDIPRYINKVVSTMPENGSHQATLNLSPAGLGKVSIEISLNGNMASIQFKADSTDAVKSIESQMSNLKDSLAKNGIKIESVGVEQKNIDLSNSGNGGNNNPQGENSQQNQEKIKRDYLNYLRSDGEDMLGNIDLSNSESLPIRGKSQSNNNSLERYI